MAHLEHVGIAVDDVNAVIDCFHELLGADPYKAEAVPTQQVRTHFLDAGGPKLELLDALDDDSPVQRFLDRQGEALHHLAFEVADVEAAMSQLRAAGFELLSNSPQQGADDKEIFFVHPKQTHGVLVEFCESAPPSWSPEHISRHDGHLAVFERGHPRNPSVLLLHGAAGSTLYETAPLIRRLERTFHVIGVDLSGHGTSAFPADSFTLDTFVDDALHALDTANVSSASVFGFSLGGAVALRLAQRHPERVNHLALFQSNARWTEALSDRMQQRLDLASLQDRAPDRADHLRSIHDDSERLFQQLHAFVDTLPTASEELWEALPAIEAPTLVSSVDRDPLFGSKVPQHLHRRLPNARLAILPGEQHSLAEGPLSLLVPLLRQFFDDS